MNHRVTTLLTSKRFVLILTGGSGLALLALFTFLNPEPYQAIALGLFLILSFILIFCLITLITKFSKLSQVPSSLGIWEALGLSLLTWGLLAFRVFGILTWWNLLLVIFAALVFEAYLRVNDAV